MQVSHGGSMHFRDCLVRAQDGWKIADAKLGASFAEASAFTFRVVF